MTTWFPYGYGFWHHVENNSAGSAHGGIVCNVAFFVKGSVLACNRSDTWILSFLECLFNAIQGNSPGQSQSSRTNFCSIKLLLTGGITTPSGWDVTSLQSYPKHLFSFDSFKYIWEVTEDMPSSFLPTSTGLRLGLKLPTLRYNIWHIRNSLSHHSFNCKHKFSMLS